MRNKICHIFLHIVLFMLLLVLLCFKITTSTSVSYRPLGAAALYKCTNKERDALLDFKAHLQDDSDILSTWTSEKEEDYECCKWNGVTCNDQTGHVTRLNLSRLHTGVSLGGKISPSLLNLSDLSYLDLFGNSFSGTIPMFIGFMTQLRYLDLNRNSFSGTIPNSIGSLTKLRYLDLSFNYFSGTIPTFIGSLTKLTHLDFSGNYLYGNCIPPELGNLTNLQELSLRYLESCTVQNIDWLSHMSDLTLLDMDDISLAKANKWVNVILSLKKLSYLSLRRCDLSQVIQPYSSSFVNSSSSIVTLNLDDNNLNSSMYHSLLPLTSNKLRDLSLNENMLDDKYFGNFCSLTSLQLSYNSVVVKLPHFLKRWSGCTSVRLQFFYAPYSRFTGSLTDEIQMFSYLEILNLEKNELNGSISEKLWELPTLRCIYLSNSSVKGVLSETHLINPSYIEVFDLSTCNLGPRFPKWIQNFKSLTMLDIANSGIFDTTPVEFWNNWPSQLTYLNLSANHMSGEAPDLLSNIDPNYFSTIDLSCNNFYGYIENVPSALTYLDLSRNKFQGEISFLCQISDGFLIYLDLTYNSFTGTLPNCLWHFKGLKFLNLGYNNLSGRLPVSVESLTGLQMLCLYNNNLSGELTSLKNCTELTFLDLGVNKFTGSVPLWLGERFPRLYVLSLTSNKLLGPIPLQLCQLPNLQILDLSMNNLYGAIPSCVNNFTTMVQEGILYKQNVHGVSNIGLRVYKPSSLLDYIDRAMINWQGYTQEFSTNLGYLKSIDLSRNNLTGHIPYELTDLHGLIALNLSNNALHGKIPWKIGDMRKLLALDLSRNNLSGEMPPSMSKMNLLNYLDVSYNNLSGRIPTSTQLQSFETSRYTGNAELCGLPLPVHCLGDEGSEVPPVVGESEDDVKEMNGLWGWFYIGGATGFAIGFWIVCGTLLLNWRARLAFFQFLESLHDKVYVEVVVFIAKLERFYCE